MLKKGMPPSDTYLTFIWWTINAEIKTCPETVSWISFVGFCIKVESLMSCIWVTTEWNIILKIISTLIKCLSHARHSAICLSTSFHVTAKEILLYIFIIILEVRKARLRVDEPGFQDCTGNLRFIMHIFLT